MVGKHSKPFVAYPERKVVMIFPPFDGGLIESGVVDYIATPIKM